MFERTKFGSKFGWDMSLSAYSILKYKIIHMYYLKGFTNVCPLSDLLLKIFFWELKKF